MPRIILQNEQFLYFYMRMKLPIKHILLLIILVPSLCYGRYYHQDEILAKSDSIMLEAIGHRYFPFCKVDNGSFYEYINVKKKSFYEPLFSKKTLHLGLKRISVK